MNTLSPNYSGVFRRYHAWLSMGQRLLDAGIVFVLLPVLCVLQDVPYGQLYQIAAIFGAALTWIAMGAVDAYRPWRGARLWQEARVLIVGWLIVVTGLFLCRLGLEIYSHLLPHCYRQLVFCCRR